jgi:trehalose 6-phosphate synthase
MNLVARELNAALVVNPYDIGELAQALHRALDIYTERPERIERWSVMMKTLRGGNIVRWYDGFIDSLRESMMSSSTASRSVA